LLNGKTVQVSLYELKKKLYLCLMSVNALEAIRFYVSFACSFAFAERELMEGNAKIIKLMWGTEGSAPPVMSWKEVNGSVTVNTGFQSFDDAFGDKVAREEVIELVSRGKYRVRRNT
jgi:hypothetical protein